MVAEIYLRVWTAVILGLATVHGQRSICADIVFGFDTSCSISDEVKDGTKDFMKELVRQLSSSAVPNNDEGRTRQFGLLSFDRDASEEFGFGDTDTLDDVIENIEDFDHAAKDCKTIISTGIDMSIDNFFGDENDENPDVFILLTDGRTQPQKFRDNTTASIERLRKRSSTYVILVQLPNKNEKTDFEDTVTQVNSLADTDNILQYSNDATALAETVFNRLNMIARELQCPAPTGAGEGNRTCPRRDVPLDVLLILDHSNSIKPENIIKVREAMEELVNEFENVGDGDKSVKFALLTYNNKVTPVMLFNDDASSTSEGTLLAINNSATTRRKNTRTDLALEYANSVVFKTENGDRPDAYNVLILVTDGRTMKARYQKNTIAAADAIKARTGKEEVSIFLLGLPGARKKNLNIQKQEWNAIPSPPTSTHFREFESFEDLLPFITELSLRVCAAGLGL